MKYSIIVSSFNNVATLPRLFDSLEKQTFQDFEVHFCDDGSDCTTVEMLQYYCEGSDKHFLHLQKNSGSYAKNLNQGLRNAKGEYCLIINADSFPELDYLELLNEHVAFNRLVCGIRVQMDEGIAVDLDWRIKKGAIPTETVLLSAQPWNQMTGNGLCIPTDALHDYGYFDERFKVNEGEDAELIARLFFKGYLCYSVPYLRLYHQWHKSNDSKHGANSEVNKIVYSYAR